MKALGETMTVAKSVLVSLVVAACAAAGAQGDVALVQRFAPGRYVLTVTTGTYQYFRLPPKETGEPALRIVRTLVLGLDAAAPDAAGRTRITASFSRIAQTITVRGRKVAYDSDVKNGEYNRLRVLLAPLLKTNVTVVMDQLGDVAEVKGLDSYWDTRANRDVSLRAWVKPMKVELGDAMIRRMFSAVPSCRPPRPVKSGESWQRPMKYRLPHVGQRSDSRKITLESVGAAAGGRPVAVLKLLAQVKDTTPVKVQVDQLPLTVRRIVVMHQGTIRIDTKTGLPLETETLLRSTLWLSGQHPKRGALTREVNQKLTEKVTIRREQAVVLQPTDGGAKPATPGRGAGASKGS